MPAKWSADHFIKQLESHRSPEQSEKYRNTFKSNEDDEFMGVRMGQIFTVAKEFIDMPVDEIEKLLESPIHEVRVGAVSIMDYQARRKKTSETRKKELFDLYIRRHDRINDWDLVDRAAPYVVGGYLFDKAHDKLYELAQSDNLWERRTAIVSTYYFIRQDQVEDTFKIAEILVSDTEDLVQKAVGGWIREAGKRQLQNLLDFLDTHAATMPRTTLRYAIEHLEPDQRTHYLNLKDT